MSLNTAEGNFEYVIWSNEYLDWADWQEAFDGEFDHCSDEEKYRLMSNLNNDYLEDDRNEMNICVGSPIIIIADIGKWDGRHTGYREIESGCLKDCLYTELDGVTWYVDNKGDFRMDGYQAITTTVITITSTVVTDMGSARRILRTSNARSRARTDFILTRRMTKLNGFTTIPILFLKVSS